MISQLNQPQFNGGSVSVQDVLNSQSLKCTVGSELSAGKMALRGLEEVIDLLEQKLTPVSDAGPVKGLPPAILQVTSHPALVTEAGDIVREIKNFTAQVEGMLARLRV